MSGTTTHDTEAVFRTCLVYSQYRNADEEMEATVANLMSDLLHLAVEYGIDPHYLAAESLRDFDAAAV